ncbi:hypothetical protein [Flavobacterium sedimenticola]|uniref:Uncharacterized protein n=1 Tax=Flavobacterium sedimenticola TaxID=3043286 RepID=A0ABT6XP60_9FLAO|nr:hypothetical protein [Flavobacterium sedimenticola]MDI9256865.1 hypothetical protein [Flavobacterium sedimenticola]
MGNYNSIDDFVRMLDSAGWFWQGLVVSFVASFLIWLGRKFISIVKYFWVSRTANQEEQIAKHIVHKYHISRNGMYDFMFGYSYSFHKAIRNILPGIISLIFGHALYLIFDKLVFELVGFYVAVQYFINALSWLNPKWAEKKLEDFDFELVKKVAEEFAKYDIHSKNIFDKEHKE